MFRSSHSLSSLARTVARTVARTSRCAPVALLTLVAGVAGQTLVADIHPSGSSYPDLFRSCWFEGRLYFAADDGTHGAELWCSDGTASGTALVADVRPGSAGSSPTLLVAFRGAIYFVANDGVHGSELWRTDGTATGTTMVADVRPGSASSSMRDLMAVGDHLFFAADDGAHGLEPWVSDGTATGTMLLADVRPGANASSPQQFADVHGAVLFRADDGTTGAEPWISDGTPAGTRLFVDATPGAGSTWPLSFTPFGPVVLFAGHANIDGTELWVTDGTAAGTHMVLDLGTGALSGVNGPIVRLGDAVYFNGGPSGDGLWKSDGTATGTVAVASGSAQELTVAGDRLFWVNEHANGVDLWVTDGSTSGTQDLGTIHTYGRMEGYGLSAAGPGVVFLGEDPVHGDELWTSDGTAMGTGLRADLVPGSASSDPDGFVAHGGRVWFRANGSEGNELWRLEAATVETFGSACTGTGTLAPRIAALGAPRIGRTWTPTLSAAQPTALAALLLGTGRSSLPLPPTGACRILVDSILTQVLRTTDTTGRASLDLAIPGDPLLLGVSLDLQWLAEDPSGPALGVATASAALEATVGS
ncbi:MAG: hypothetical protein R3F56_14910 [Planctomycetota bacterium]